MKTNAKKIISFDQEFKIEEILLCKRSIKQNENSFITEDISFNRTQTTYFKNRNLKIGSIVTVRSNHNKSKWGKEKEVSFNKNLVDYVDVTSFKEFNKENYHEPDVLIKTEDMPCEIKCKFLHSHCLIF